MTTAPEAKANCLCPWGVVPYEEPDSESLLASNPMKALQNTAITGLGTKKMLSQTEFKAFVDDEGNQFRCVICVSSKNHDYLKNLHNHPCERLIILFGGVLKKGDVQNIARCQGLRMVVLTKTKISDSLLKLFKQLQKLEIFAYDSVRSVKAQIKTLHLLPNIHTLQLRAPKSELTREQTTEVREIIWARKGTLRHVIFEFHLTREVLTALRACANLETLSLHDAKVPNEDFLHFFADPFIQRTLRFILLNGACITAPVVSLLTAFTNIHTLEMGSKSIPTASLCAILRNNAPHIRHVILFEVKFDVSIDLLEAIEKCEKLELFYVKCRKIIDKHLLQEYTKAKRRNYAAIYIEEFDASVSA